MNLKNVEYVKWILLDLKLKVQVLLNVYKFQGSIRHKIEDLEIY